MAKGIFAYDQNKTKDKNSYLLTARKKRTAKIHICGRLKRHMANMVFAVCQKKHTTNMVFAVGVFFLSFVFLVALGKDVVCRVPDI